MQIEITKDEAGTLREACITEETLMSQYFARRAPGIGIHRYRAQLTSLQAKLSDAIDAEEKREQVKAKADAETASVAHKGDVPPKE